MARTHRILTLLLIGVILPLFLNGEAHGEWFFFNRAQARSRKCIQLYEAGDYPEARECTRQFLSDYPDSRWSELLYFLDAKMETDAPNAVKKYHWFLNTYPQGPYSPEAAFLLGELYELEGDFSGAQEVYMRVYLSFPASRSSKEAGLRAAKCMLVNNDIPSALNHLEEYIFLHTGYPWNTRAKELHADILFQQGAYEKAQAEYRQVISTIPANDPPAPRCYLRVAKIYEILGDHESALRCYSQFLKNFPDSALQKTAEERMLELSNILQLNPSAVDQSHVVEVGAFASEPDAVALVVRLKELGYQAYIRKSGPPDNSFSVRLGPYKTKELVDIITEKLRREVGLNALILSGDVSETETSGER
jgi:TolA-binding protein